jgi:hypothetical protein
MPEERKPLKPLSKAWQELAERFRDTAPSGDSHPDMPPEPPDASSGPATPPAPVQDAPAADQGVEISVDQGAWHSRRVIHRQEELDHILDAVEARESDAQQAMQDEESDGQGPSPSPGR